MLGLVNVVSVPYSANRVYNDLYTGPLDLFFQLTPNTGLFTDLKMNYRTIL